MEPASVQEQCKKERWLGFGLPCHCGVCLEPRDRSYAAKFFLALDGPERLVTLGPKGWSLEEMVLEDEIPKLVPALQRLRENTLWWIEDDEDLPKNGVIDGDDVSDALKEWFMVCKWCCEGSRCPTPPITLAKMVFGPLTVINLWE